jgi:hypothetical protein
LNKLLERDLFYLCLEASLLFYDIVSAAAPTFHTEWVKHGLPLKRTVVAEHIVMQFLLKWIQFNLSVNMVNVLFQIVSRINNFAAERTRIIVIFYRRGKTIDVYWVPAM